MQRVLVRFELGRHEVRLVEDFAEDLTSYVVLVDGVVITPAPILERPSDRQVVELAARWLGLPAGRA